MHQADLVTQIRSYLAGEVSTTRPNPVTMLTAALKEIERGQRVTASVEQLSAKWRAAASQAENLVNKFEAKHDGANSYAFRKERRIWATCADELLAAIVSETGAPQP